MRVSELIDMLKDQPPDAEVELAIVAPVGDDSDEDITVDRYSVEGMLPALTRIQSGFLSVVSAGTTLIGMRAVFG